MDDATRNMIVTIGAGIAKKVLLGLGATLATHGIINSNQTETFVSAGMVVIGIGWSLWNDFGRAIILSQLEVLKAKCLAQAEQARNARLPPITANQIAAQSRTMSPTDVTKAVATLPAEIQANVKAAALVAILALGALFAFAGDASAQIKVRLPDPLKLNQPAQPAAAPAPRTAADPLARVMDQLAAVQQKVVDGVVADIMAADADAASLTNPADPTSFKDPISHACYPAGIKFLQSLPVATAPTGEFILVQLFQKKRDFIAQIRAGLPVYLKLGCAPLLGDEAAIFTKLIGLVGVKVGLDALAPGLGLAMPVL
jgi:hypothetical protein